MNLDDYYMLRNKIDRVTRYKDIMDARNSYFLSDDKCIKNIWKVFDIISDNIIAMNEKDIIFVNQVYNVFDKYRDEIENSIKPVLSKCSDNATAPVREVCENAIYLVETFEDSKDIVCHHGFLLPIPLYRLCDKYHVLDNNDVAIKKVVLIYEKILSEICKLALIQFDAA